MDGQPFRRTRGPYLSFMPPQGRRLRPPPPLSPRPRWSNVFRRVAALGLKKTRGSLFEGGVAIEGMFIDSSYMVWVVGKVEMLTTL